MTKYLKNLFLASLTLCLALGFASATREEFFPAAPPIWEDDPRWDCATMGNKTCGAPIRVPRAEVICADALNIAWSEEDGATERLSEWGLCMERISAWRTPAPALPHNVEVMP